jgi:integrase
MAGSRSLTSLEARALIRHVRNIRPRDRSLLTCQLFTGFRISEILSLTIGHISENGRIREKMGLSPRFLKGGYGNTRWIPICPELRRALEGYLSTRDDRQKTDAPLFPSREAGASGVARSLGRSAAEKLIKAQLIAIAEGDHQGLSTHSLRKTWARELYERSGHDILLVRDGLGHSSVDITQRYLATNRDRLDELILRGDWTRQSRRSHAQSQPGRVSRSEAAILKPKRAIQTETSLLPGLEAFAA